MAAKKVRKNFCWTSEMVENRIDFLSACKSSMEYKSPDFHADKPAQYKHLRKEMAQLYSDEDEVFFRPVRKVLPIENIDELSNEEKAKVKKKQARERELISKGYNRIVEKVKEIRQCFSKAVVAGSRSGCGKVVFEFYDKLVTIWGGSANTEPLSFGLHQKILIVKVMACKICKVSWSLRIKIVIQEVRLVVHKRERLQKMLFPPKLVDNKCKHLEKNLSVAERDKILINEAKQEKEARQNFTAVLRQSNQCFMKTMECMSKSMQEVGSGISRSIEMLANAASGNNLHPQFPVNQNIFNHGIQPNYPAPVPYPGYQPFYPGKKKLQELQIQFLKTPMMYISL